MVVVRLEVVANDQANRLSPGRRRLRQGWMLKHRSRRSPSALGLAATQRVSGLAMGTSDSAAGEACLSAVVRFVALT